MEEVMVTASRREEALQDVAVAVSVLDPLVFANAGKTNLRDLLPFVPGVVLQDTGATQLQGVVIRGIAAYGSGGVGTYIDDIPYGSATLYTTGGAPIDGTLLDLESLNVLKGPQGTLYGSASMSGLLKFITRNASLEEWHGDFSADLSDTNGGRVQSIVSRICQWSVVRGFRRFEFYRILERQNRLHRQRCDTKGWLG